MKNNLAAYELMAIGVAAFLIDHTAYTFLPDELWLRVLRLFGLVWFIPLGYNSGHKVTRRMWEGAVLLMVLDYALGIGVFPMSAMSTIVLVRLVINPVAEVAVKSKTSFYAVTFLLLGMVPVTHMATDYGTAAVIIALGGWLLKNREQASRVVNIKAYFAFLTVVYLALALTAFDYTPAQMAVVIVSTVLTAALMFDFRAMLVNDLKRKSRDIVSSTCRFIGHKSLEIYILLWIALKLLLLVALMPE